MLDPAQRSSWQLAQEVWQESGVTWERTAPELADSDPAADWFPDADEPARAAPPTNPPARARGRPALSPRSPSPPASSPAEPADALSPRRRARAAADPRAEPVGFEPAAAERVADPAGAVTPEAPPTTSTASAWTGYAEPERSDGDGPAADEWSGYGEPEDPEPAGFGRPGRRRFADSGVEGAAPAETWFTGAGPADTRFAAAGHAHPGRADAWRPGPSWSEYPPDGFPGQAWPAGSGRMPLGAPVALDLQAPESADLRPDPTARRTRVGRRRAAERAR